jgi:hypothetical protein
LHSLVPKLWLRNAGGLGSSTFIIAANQRFEDNFVPKLELGNEEESTRAAPALPPFSAGGAKD